MNDELTVGTAGVVLVVIIAVALVLIGISIGTSTGEDAIANTWCISLGYDTGEYDATAQIVVCNQTSTPEEKPLWREK